MPDEENVPAKILGPAAPDETTENAGNGAAKRRDGDEPAAVVGLGASAGGIAVLQQFFSDMPVESGLAFVVVMHLSPEHESNLASIIQQRTAMPVKQVNEPVKVRPNCVYVIPPNKQLAFEDGTLQLLDPQQALGRRVTIDLFFRTLAHAYGQRAVCIILSGTDSDGVIGLKHVHAQGGITVAQDPKEAEHDSMPLSAISTGMVDWVLPVTEMTPKLMEFVHNDRRMQLPPEILEADAADVKDKDAPGETVAKKAREARDESALREVLTVLRRQTGHDFSHYKRATLLRRIARRMQVNSIESIPEYLKFFRKHRAEANELLHDLLIGVTHFFRDRASFASLESNIPQLFAGKQKNDQIRVWAAGCATGEEAYSIAMLLCEHAERLDSPPSIQIFASDIDEHSIQDARRGVYPVTIEADVSPERLRRFFAKDHGRYRVRKDLREKVLFAAHNLLSDPPFSNLDLVSCRNLLIYLNSKAQDLVFDIFHFSLRAGGLLFIGGSESGSQVHTLFSPVDAKHHLYVRRSVPRPSWRIPLLPPRARDLTDRAPVASRLRVLPALTATAVEAAATETRESTHAGQERRAVLFGELHLKMLEQYGPPSVVVNESYDIVHLSENAGRYLQFAPGEPTANLMKVVNPALQIELRTALFRASQMKAPIEGVPAMAEFDGTKEVITLTVRPIRANDLEQGFYLILFAKQDDVAPPPPTLIAHDALTRNLEAEIEVLKRQVNDTGEQYEAANEELKAANEELQAMNEEMRSATEELETSKEELQSVNEELITVNNELKSSVEELSRTNADLTNLMASTDIGTIFLDRQLRVQRFTPSAQKIFNLIPADVGRPISDITHKLAYDVLVADAENVLENLAAIEREVRLADEQWVLVRIAPYRTAEDRIAGVVATFVDITRRKRMELELRESETRLRRALEIETVGVLFFASDGRITDANEAFLQMSGYTREDLANGLVQWNRITAPEWLERSGAKLEEFNRTGKMALFEKQYVRKDGSRWWALASATRLSDGLGVKYVIDIDETKQAEQALHASEARFRQFAENSADVLWIIDAKTHRLEYLSPAYERIWGESREPIMRDLKRWEELVHPDDRKRVSDQLGRVIHGETFINEYRIIRPTDGQTRWIRDTGFPVRGDDGRIQRLAGVAQDITEDKIRTEALAESEERFRLLVEGARDYAMFMLDPGNQIIYWSSGAERVFGWSANEALGRSGEIVFTPEDRVRKQEQKEIHTALRKGVASDRRWHLRKDGSRVWIDGVMRRLNDEKGNLRGFAKIARDATELRLAEDQLHASHQQLEQRVRERTAQLSGLNKKLETEIKERAQVEQELLLVSEREKRRIGQDLHDSLCQELAAAALFLRTASHKMGKKSPSGAKVLEDAARIVNDNVGLARDLARGLHPVELSSQGLANALRELAFRTSQVRSVTCHFECPHQVRIRDEAVALNLYRIAQEAVANAVKHGKATTIAIKLVRDGKELALSVKDDGKGFSPAKPRHGMGLHIMKYRAGVIGARLTIESADGHGTLVNCVLPGE